MASKLNIKTMTEEEIRHFEQPLSYFLWNEKLETLKKICKFYEIKGYSNKKKEDLIHLIVTHIFKDLSAADKMFDVMSVEDYNVLNHLLIADTYSTAFTGKMPVQNLIFIIEEHAFIPSDVKEYLRRYVVEKSQAQEQSDEVKLLVSAVNLYGYFSLSQYRLMAERFLNRRQTEQQLEQELQGIATVKDGFVLNPLIEAAQFHGAGIEEKRQYYIPSSWEDFQRYFAFEYHEPSEELDALISYLSPYMNDINQKKDIRDTITVMMKMIDNPDNLMSIINDMINEKVLAPVKMDETAAYMINAYRTIRNWHLGGHKMNEIMQPERRVINKRVESRKKKRKKKNISRVKK
ncbi:hypothetical protein ERX37_09855 [Macrococcus hajekii]|uniref:Rho termination factor N-terminal domain-containing protein n=1 Tax=Macrococcus hajekii TaxID=198482 RepID=A0A4R6BI80_9STAP|nr:hypothetical protein [Macrococcus hajekii]TDM01176.1 hypothetical protein ERX37_09855 [Macrococcus hajekii]GGB11929.1 hypothetical protein GCM10007190_20000 [Macrococcus hajekii]